MKYLLLTLIVIIISFNNLYSQEDTTQTNNLLGDIMTSDTISKQELLPQSFLYTQKLLWGESGLMRNFDRFKLTPENRAYELKIRRTMLVSHQVLGFATLGCMVAQGIVGSKLYVDKQNGIAESKYLDAHEALSSAINIGYFTTAALSLFAPPKMVDERKGYSSIKVHKALAIIHLTSMVATNVLAGMLESNPELRPYHRAAAFTAFGSFAASMIIIKF